MSDIVKDSETLKQAIVARIDELGLTGGQISADAKKRGINGFTERALSTFLNHPYAKGSLNQYQIIWLAYRLGIRVELKVGEPVMDGKKLRYIVPQPFNEEKAIARLKEVFPFLEEVVKIDVKKPRKKKK